MIADLAAFGPDVTLMLGYVPSRSRERVAALWAMDARLAAIVAAAREPSLGLIRLVWWRDALEALGSGAPPAEPLLAAAAAAGIDGAGAATIAEGWEALLDDPALGDEAIARHATMRGARLFAMTGTLLGADPADGERLSAAGEGWALADLARSSGNRAAAIRARALPPLERAMARRWPRRLRPLGQLAAIALAEARGGVLAPRARALRTLRHQLTGR